MNALPHKILIVDDDPAVVELMKESFDGGRISTAFNLKEAREALKKTKPDLVILDRMLPDGDGLELCAEIRKDPQYQTLPLLMLTGKAETADKVTGLKMGADDYLTKPFELAELKVRVEALLRRADEFNLRRSMKRSMWKY